MTVSYGVSTKGVEDKLTVLNQSSTRWARVMVFVGVCQIILAIAQIFLALSMR